MKFLSQMRTGFIALMLGVAGLITQPAEADFITGHQLNTYCNSQDAADDMICIVYITGAFDAFTTTDLINQKATQAPATLCPNTDISPDELKQVTLDWMKRPETDFDFAATLIVLGAIQNKYACEK